MGQAARSGLDSRSRRSSVGTYNSNPFRSNDVDCVTRALNGIRQENVLDISKEVLAVIDEVLSLGGRALAFDRETPLLGAVPELDSMAVVGVINLLEERFGFVIEDDEIDGSSFATVGTLVEFVEGKLG